MSDREGIVELTDEVERWMQQLMLERKAHEATRESLRLAGDLLRYSEEERADLEAMLRSERDAYSRSLERALAVIDFWEAEAARGRACRIAYHTDRLAWERWYADWYWYSALDATGIETAPQTQDGIPVPRIVWWHAHRRTTR